MTKGYILEIAERNNFNIDREVSDLAGTHFFTVSNPTTDLVFMYRDHKDGDYYLMGLYKVNEGNRMMDRIPKTR